MSKKNELVLFYAWQSDSPAETNRTAIRDALKAVVERLEAKDPTLSIVIDDATRGMVGSGNVPDSIRLKIEACDIFVGDVTTINWAAEGSPPARPCPNPNVTFEVGYAAAHVGWDRIVLVMNLALGAMSDLPFDFDRHRVSGFNLSQAPNTKKRKNLADLLAVAIGAIVEGDPPRPADLRALDPAEIRRQRDVANIIWAMSQVASDRLDAIIDALPEHVGHYAHNQYENFHAVVTSASFHLYDRKLAKAFRKLDKAWSSAFSYGQHYFTTPGGLYAFGTPGGLSSHPDEERDFRRIAEAATAMRHQLEKLLARIRTRYLEVDLVETDRVARKRLAEEIAELEGGFNAQASDQADEAEAVPAAPAD